MANCQQMRFRVHRNLHRARAGGPQWVVTQRGKVQEYRSTVALLAVNTRIRAATRKRCEVQQRRTVCAYIEGEITNQVMSSTGAWCRISFDPRREANFMACDSDGARRPWNTADAARFDEDGTGWALNARWELIDAMR